VPHDNIAKDAILIHIEKDRPHIPEMMELAGSSGFNIIEIIGQKRKEPDPKFYVGPGKLDEIALLEVENLIIPSDLTPSQVYNISQRTKKIVSDRTRIILDIFNRRAMTQEAKLQVEIADLRYQIPVLREYIHQGKLSERPGFLSGGEYKVDYYYEMIRKRMAFIRKKLEKERERRKNRRNLRRRRGYHQISIAGYTNAGKSTLLNRLIDADDPGKKAEMGPMMFTTIGTTTRKMKGGRNCLISDTVGFIRDLPPWLVEGFISTLEEIFMADIILLVIDISEDMETVRSKLSESLGILRRGASLASILITANKIDRVDGQIERSVLEEILREAASADNDGAIKDIIFTSADSGEGIEDLVERIHQQLPLTIEYHFRIPMGEKTENAVSQMRRYGSPRIEYNNHNEVHIFIELEEKTAGKFIKMVGSLGGEDLTMKD
jgi:GTP-binding protein HflX